MTNLNETAHKLLDAAEQYTQTRGFNGFSYKDLQRDVGVKTSSIHYYFPTKQDLAIQMMERYLERFTQTLDQMDNEFNDGISKLASLAGKYTEIIKNGKFCMCGMLSSEIMALPAEANSKLCAFFDLNTSWIAKAIKEGQKDGTVNTGLTPEKAAPHFLATLEGGMLIARAHCNSDYYENILEEAMTHLAA